MITIGYVHRNSAEPHFRHIAQPDDYVQVKEKGVESCLCSSYKRAFFYILTRDVIMIDVPDEFAEGHKIGTPAFKEMFIKSKYYKMVKDIQDYDIFNRDMELYYLQAKSDLGSMKPTGDVLSKFKTGQEIQNITTYEIPKSAILDYEFYTKLDVELLKLKIKH